MAIFPIHISTPRLREDRWLGVPPNPAYFTALGEDAPVSPHAKRAKRGWGSARAVRPPKQLQLKMEPREKSPVGHLSICHFLGIPLQQPDQPSLRIPGHWSWHYPVRTCWHTCEDDDPVCRPNREGPSCSIPALPYWASSNHSGLLLPSSLRHPAAHSLISRSLLTQSFSP